MKRRPKFINAAMRDCVIIEESCRIIDKQRVEMEDLQRRYDELHKRYVAVKDMMFGFAAASKASLKFIWPHRGKE